MSEEHDPVEMLLARMKPAPMNTDLMARLTAARPTTSPKRSGAWSFLSRWAFAAGAVACAAVVTVKVLDSSTNTAKDIASDNPEKAAAKNMPVIVQDNMLQAREMGVMMGPNRQPYQVMEYQWVESETLVPGTNVPSVRLETTRRQIVPVRLEVY